MVRVERQIGLMHQGIVYQLLSPKRMVCGNAKQDVGVKLTNTTEDAM